MILLDTHILLWWLNESFELSPKLRAVIEEHRWAGIAVSVISLWEIANLVRLDRIQLTIPVMDWVEEVLSMDGIRLLDLTPRIAVEATLLSDFHRDPADRFLVATARHFDIPIMTRDAKIVQYAGVKVIA